MTESLIDVNVLLALLDPDHTFHIPAVRWFRDHAHEGWATCPITENGFVRVASHPSYPRPRTVAEAINSLKTLLRQPAHVFWSDENSVADDHIIDIDHLLSSRQITDVYLLSLAVRANGRFITFDRRIDVAAVRGATKASLLVLGLRADS